MASEQSNLMKTKCKSSLRAACRTFAKVFCAGTVLLLALKGQAQNLFEADYASGNIYEFTPGGVRSTFASGLPGFSGLAFNSAGDLFVANESGSNIYEFTPDGARSTFASGLNHPLALAFQGEALPVPEPSALGLLAISATALLIRRHRCD